MLLPNANDAGVAMAQAESGRAYCTLALGRDLDRIIAQLMSVVVDFTLS